MADRVLALARAGRAVRVVTDHGWLLLPGGLPTAKLDSGLLEPQGRRSRCALVKEGAPTTYLHLPWSWNQEVQVAVATGARAFIAGQEYAHGGISPQECILPLLDVQPLAAPTRIEIPRATWQGLRLRVEVGSGADLRADLRAGASTAGGSLVKGGRVLDEQGRTSMLVSDIHEGEDACLVIVDDHGNVLASRVLKVGGE